MDGKRINIIGGKSINGSVSIQSDEFVSTATSLKDGRIMCVVRPVSQMTRYTSKHNHWIIPKVFKLVLFLMDGIGKKDLVFFGLTAGFFLGIILLIKSILPGGVETFNDNFWIWDLMLWIPVLLFLRKSVAAWHGAEHMTIASYVNTGRADIASIRRQSPIDPHCGGRFLIVLLMVQQVSTYLSNTISVSGVPVLFVVLFINLAVMEFVLRIDGWKGLDNLPITSQASYLLQKYITTTTPGQQELKTAQQALLGLIKAHHVV